MPRNSEQDHNQEQESSVYYVAARFADEHIAAGVYAQAQDIVFVQRSKCDLSVYRFLLDEISHVAVLGQRPSAELEQRIIALLSSGEAAAIPDEVLAVLVQRRRQASRIGGWVEGHYRPGKRLFNPER